MRTVSVSWDQAHGRFVALGKHDGQAISINAPPAPGADRGPTGFSATELLLAGAGACAAWDVLEILRKRRAQIDSLEVRVDADQLADPPWTYERIALHFRIAGGPLSLLALMRIVRLSCVRYCSVLTTVSAVAAIEATIELVASDGTSTGRHMIELALPEVLPAGSVAPTTDEE